jgi:hypothetical protein
MAEKIKVESSHRLGSAAVAGHRFARHLVFDIRHSFVI